VDKMQNILTLNAGGASREVRWYALVTAFMLLASRPWWR